jgi:RNA polymerase sigma-70 factor (ECF subfamily)
MPDSKEIPDSSAQAGAESPPAVSPEPAAEDLDAAAAGDAAAFARLYMALQPRLSRYASSLVGQDADDVTAEAWLQIARDLHGFTGTVDAFRAWTARIVRNRAMDHLRAQARRPVQSAPIDELFDVAATDDTAVGAIDRLSTAGALALIRSLPRDQAEAVLLRAVVGLDAKSAGQVLGKSAAAVRVASHRGLKTLAKRVRIDDAKPRP